jgi:hypothetical protein
MWSVRKNEGLNGENVKCNLEKKIVQFLFVLCMWFP